MAWPPEIRVLSTPGSASTRTAPLVRAAAALTCSSLAPVTVLSTETTTWLVAGSVHQAVPGILADRSSSAVAGLSSAAPRVTSFGVAPAARTWRAAAASVTVTTIVPLASAYVPAERSPSRAARVAAASGEAGDAGAAWAGAPSSEPATRVPATATVAARRSEDLVGRMNNLPDGGGGPSSWRGPWTNPA